jgi:hypothetical protein
MKLKKNFLKVLLIYILVFVAVFTLNASFSMDETHGFFYLTPVKLTIRLIVSVMITANIYIRFIYKPN